jgi:hypothetical protein
MRRAKAVQHCVLRVIQIWQAKDDFLTKGFPFFSRIRAASTPQACLEGYICYINSKNKKSSKGAQAI